MASGGIVSPDNQSATFVELFFDLVFVFSITQIVALFHHGIDWTVVGRAILVFWLVWWAWTQFTWALNAADTTHPLVELGTLVATGVAFFMAVAVPDAFHGHALAFAIPYVVVRAVGLGLYSWVASAVPSRRAAVNTFAALSTAGLIAVVAGGYVGGAAQYWIWGLAIVFDVIAAGIGGRLAGWNLHPAHFGERHGLIVIIALGETLIVAAAGLSGRPWTGSLAAVALLAVVTTCAMWWCYFARAHPALERALHECPETTQASIARDAFSLMHFPMLCGVVAYAVAVEEMLAHPDESLTSAARVALGAGVLLFVGGMAVAIGRATSTWLLGRLALCGVGGAVIVSLGDVAAWESLFLALVATVFVAVVEQRKEVYP